MIAARTAPCIVAAMILVSPPLAAQTPAGVSELIDTALRSGDQAGLDAVLRYAKQAHPQAAEAIDAQVAAFRTSSAGSVTSAPLPSPAAPSVVVAAVPIPAQVAAATPAAAAPAQEAVAEVASVKWSGEGELGAFTTTGNAPGMGLAAGLKLSAEGEDWRIGLLGRADYQETNDVVVREQYRFSAEPNYKFNERGYVYGLGQYEQDRFQGFHARYSASGGIGYSLLTGENAQLNVKAGPAWRFTRLVTGMDESVIAGLASVDIKLKLSPTIQLTEAASAYVDEQRSTLFSVAALDSQLIGKLKARLSYTVQYESAPALGRAPTDTTSRLTLVYGF
jgi:putative salt-induced outer membrane protein